MTIYESTARTRVQSKHANRSQNRFDARTRTACDTLPRKPYLALIQNLRKTEMITHIYFVRIPGVLAEQFPVPRAQAEGGKASAPTTEIKLHACGAAEGEGRRAQGQGGWCAHGMPPLAGHGSRAGRRHAFHSFLSAASGPNMLDWMIRAQLILHRLDDVDSYHLRGREPASVSGQRVAFHVNMMQAEAPLWLRHAWAKGGMRAGAGSPDLGQLIVDAILEQDAARAKGWSVVLLAPTSSAAQRALCSPFAFWPVTMKLGWLKSFRLTQQKETMNE